MRADLRSPPSALQIVNHTEQEFDVHHQHKRDIVRHRRVVCRHLIHRIEWKMEHRRFDGGSEFALSGWLLTYR